MQVQLPQFRKAGMEVVAVFSRGQQRARQVAEQASDTNSCQRAACTLLPAAQQYSHYQSAARPSFAS